MEATEITAIEFANTVTDLNAKRQNEFFESLKNYLSEEDYKTTLEFVSWIGLFKSQKKYKSIRTAISQELFGMEIPFSVRSMWEK